MKMALELKAAGRLRWCQSQVCACMGCANTYPGMNKEKWDRIKMIPFVQKIINERIKTNEKGMFAFMKYIKESKCRS